MSGETVCPRIADHTDAPRGYLAWHEWAARMYAAGARQRRCPGCGLYAIWSPHVLERASTLPEIEALVSPVGAGTVNGTTYKGGGAMPGTADARDRAAVVAEELEAQAQRMLGGLAETVGDQLRYSSDAGASPVLRQALRRAYEAGRVAGASLAEVSAGSAPEDSAGSELAADSAGSDAPADSAGSDIGRAADALERIADQLARWSVPVGHGNVSLGVYTGDQ